MGLLDDAMETSKLQAKNSAMALEAQLKVADEARTANLIAVWSALTGMGSVWAKEERESLRTQIWKRLGL